MPLVEIIGGFGFCIARHAHICLECSEKITEGSLAIWVFRGHGKEFFHPKCFGGEGTTVPDWKKALDEHYKKGLLPKTVIRSLNLK